MNRGDRPLAFVAGIGNPDRGDDGFGPAVAQRLRARVVPGVEIVERRGDLLDLIEDWSGFPFAVIVDAMASIGDPGRIHRVDLTDNPLPIGFAPRSSHAFGVAETVELARSLGGLPERLIAYLVEGEQFEQGASLSPMVAHTVEEVSEQIATELSRNIGVREIIRHA
jgi:hydrogenase maturation protease